MMANGPGEVPGFVYSFIDTPLPAKPLKGLKELKELNEMNESKYGLQSGREFVTFLLDLP